MRSLLLTIILLLSQSVLHSADSPGQKEVTAKTESMLPNIPLNSMLMVDELFYEAKSPQRFDIVWIRRSCERYPGDSEKEMNIVARIIGLPGETIALRGGRIYINGRRIKEPFATKPCPKTEDEFFPCREMSPLKIPSGEYFLLADNRPESEDSRLWEPQTIPKSDVLGKVVKILPR
jgi:signal peptidase I